MVLPVVLDPMAIITVMDTDITDIKVTGTVSMNMDGAGKSIPERK